MKPVFSFIEPGYKITFLFLLLLIGIMVAAFCTSLILMIPGVDSHNGIASIYVGSFLQSILGMVLPAYCVAALTCAKPLHSLKMTADRKMGRKIVFAILVFIASYLFVSYLTQWNKKMVLPSSMQEIEEVLRSMEDSAMATTQLILSGESLWRFFLNLFIVAGMAALAEEMFFRGGLQQLLEEKFLNGHWAVWISALVFSIIHFQFYGFLPRLFLGAILGYLFLYTRNLWIPILFHFVNNAFIIIVYYFWGDNERLQQFEELSTNGWFMLVAALSAVCTVLLFVGIAEKKTDCVKRRTE